MPAVARVRPAALDEKPGKRLKLTGAASLAASLDDYSEDEDEDLEDKDGDVEDKVDGGGARQPPPDPPQQVTLQTAPGPPINPNGKSALYFYIF